MKSTEPANFHSDVSCGSSSVTSILKVNTVLSVSEFTVLDSVSVPVRSYSSVIDILETVSSSILIVPSGLMTNSIGSAFNNPVGGVISVSVYSPGRSSIVLFLSCSDVHLIGVFVLSLVSVPVI